MVDDFMIIDSSAIQLSSSHQKQTSTELRESIFRQPIPVVSPEQSERNLSAPNANDDSSVAVEISEASLALQQRLEELRVQVEEGNQGFAEAIESIFSDGNENKDEQQLDAETYQLKSLVESFIGRDIELQEVVDIERSPESSSIFSEPLVAPDRSNSVTVIEVAEQRREFEQTNFSAQGQIRTTDGQIIEIDLSQTLQREFISETRLQVIAGDAELKDPLVLNLPNSGLELTESQVDFDIDADGQLDSVHFATGNSGFLSLDLNGNGQIDDGSELFGAISGNGFADLAQYDENGNNFIDAWDSVFTRLQILRKNEDGEDSLTSLHSVGIGALYLGNTNTPFEVRDSNNELDAVVRSSGFYLTENGQAGTLQQIDLVV